MNLDDFLANKGLPRLVFASGAGLSKESGLTTFRDADEEGLWDKFSIDEICNIATFEINYQKVHAFYNQMRQGLANVNPNIAHFMIAEMQLRYGHDRVIHITANVDDLCERAGGTAMHVHGKLTEIIEPYSTNNENYKIKDIGYESHTPTPGIISKPNIVMFGEGFWFTEGKRKVIYDDLYKVLDNLTENDTVVVIGSSDTVIPWSVYAGLATPAQTLNINPEPHDNDDYFNNNIYMSITECIVPVQEYIAERMDLMNFDGIEY